MRGSLRLTLGIGLLSLVALGIPACGDDDEGGGSGGSGGTTGGTGGTGGGVAGSGGSTAGSGGGGTGGTGGTAPVVCGGETCKTYKVAGLFDIGACCAGASKDKCGADVSGTVGALVGLPAGCYQTGGPGNADTTCPELKFTNPLDGGPGSFSGCCNADTKKCGYEINLSSVGGPDMGCLDGTGLSDASPASCTPAAGDASTD